MTLICRASILGGLPVWVEIASGKDADTYNGPGDYWSEVEHIWWMKRNGERGKEIPEHIYDRAQTYDWGFCSLIENAFEQEMMEQWMREHPSEDPNAMVSLDNP